MDKDQNNDEQLVLRWHLDMIEALVRDSKDRAATWQYLVEELKRIREAQPPPETKDK